MKSTIEYSEAEFIALVTLAEKLFDRLMAKDRTAAVSSTPDDEADTRGAEQHEFAFETPPQATLPKWARSPEHHREVVTLGRVVLTDMVSRWRVNLGIEEAVQPDRAELMRSLSTGPNSGAVLAYCENEGGLLHAIDSIYTDASNGEESRRAMVNLIGSTMCQVGSILFPDIATMYEHVDIYRSKGVK